MHPVTVFIERFRAAVSVHIGPCCPALVESYSCKCAYCCSIGQIKWWWWWWTGQREREGEIKGKGGGKGIGGIFCSCNFFPKEKPCIRQTASDWCGRPTAVNVLITSDWFAHRFFNSLRHFIPTKWRSYRDHRSCDVTSPYVWQRGTSSRRGVVVWKVLINRDQVL